MVIQNSICSTEARVLADAAQKVEKEKNEKLAKSFLTIFFNNIKCAAKAGLYKIEINFLTLYNGAQLIESTPHIKRLIFEYLSDSGYIVETTLGNSNVVSIKWNSRSQI